MLEITKDQFKELVAIWRSKEYHTSADHVVYNYLRGKPLDTGFKEVTNQKHLRGNKANYAFIEAKYMAKGCYCWFGTILIQHGVKVNI